MEASRVTEWSSARRIEDVLRRCGFVEPEYRIVVDLRKGVAHLRGSVPYEGDIGLVGAVVARLDGVVSVMNRLLYRQGRPEVISGRR